MFSKIIIVLGPTASGKSELAVRLARKFKGEIISADSRQVYKGLDIGSSKVPRDKNSKSETLNSKQAKNSKFKFQNRYFYKGIKHHLLDVADPKRTFTVAQYQKLAKKALNEILKRGKVPIICGGTGFYIDALIYGYKFPEVPPQPKLRKQLEKKSTKDLFKQLKKLDPRRAKNIDKNNRRRLIRALEIVLTTKSPVPPITKTIKKSSNKSSEFDILKIGIKKTAEELKKLIKQRLLKRLKPNLRTNSRRNKQGLIEEVKNLYYKKGLSWKRLDDLGLEYRYVSRYLRGLITKEKMIETILKESWRYARRQINWFKKDKEIYWVKNYKEAEKLVKEFLK